MRLAILNLTGPGMSGGYRNYLKNILPRLADDARVQSLLCVSPSVLRLEEWVPYNRKIQLAPCPPFRPFSIHLNLQLDRLLRSFGPDVIFVPTAKAVRFHDVPVVTMVQNMAPLISWKRYGLLEKARLAALWIESLRAIRQADSVIAISDFVRQFLLKQGGISAEKINSIYFGAPSPAVPLRPPSLPSDWTDFIFTAGSIEPYRGLEDIIKGAVHFRHRGRPLKIILAGVSRESLRSYERNLKAMAEKAGISRDLFWASLLSSEEMTWCYRHCRAFVMTSRIEASPTTVLEAMACGAVCIAADNPPLPEFFGQSALYYRPGDGEMLAAKIAEVCAWSTAQRTQFSTVAHERSRAFSWGIAAGKTVNLFERLSRRR